MADKLFEVLAVLMFMLGFLAIVAFCVAAKIVPGNDPWGECAVGSLFVCGFGFFLLVVVGE
jgi:hypothetical protein